MLYENKNAVGITEPIYPDSDSDDIIDEISKRAATAMLEIVRFVWSSGSGTSRKNGIALKKLIAISAALDPGLFYDESYREIGSRVKASKSSISAYVTKISDRWGIHFRRSRRESSRLGMSLSQTGHKNYHLKKGNGGKIAGRKKGTRQKLPKAGDQKANRRTSDKMAHLVSVS